MLLGGSCLLLGLVFLFLTLSFSLLLSLVFLVLGLPWNCGLLTVSGVKISTDFGLGMGLSVVFFPFVRVNKLDLLRSGSLSIFKESDRAGSLRSLRTDATKVKVNGAVHTLDAILNEEGHLDVLLLKEFENLLPCVNEIVVGVVLGHLFQVVLGARQELVGRTALDHLDHRVDVIHSHSEDFLCLRACLHLAFEAHEHQVEELLHACWIQLHDRAVGQTLKNLLGRVHSVHGLRAEHFSHEFGRKH